MTCAREQDLRCPEKVLHTGTRRHTEEWSQKNVWSTFGSSQQETGNALSVHWWEVTKLQSVESQGTVRGSLCVNVGEAQTHGEGVTSQKTWGVTPFIHS